MASDEARTHQSPIALIRSLTAHASPTSPDVSLVRSPGARLLVQQAEHSAQRALHVLRGLLWAATAIALTLAVPNSTAISRIRTVAPWAVGLTVMWLVLWRVLSSERPPAWMRYALVYLDGAYLLEAVVLMAPPVPQLAMIPASTAADMLRAVGAPMLVFLAISGVFRIDSAAAVLSAAAAVVTYAIVAHALAMSLDQSLPAALVVAFTGAAGVVGARVIRDAVVRAGEARILEHYVPRALLGDLRRSGSGTTGREEQVSVIFVDIRGFTSLVEHLTPSEAVAFLNAYLGIAMPALLEHGAIVDKYLGDGILAFIEGKDNVNRAVAAGLAVLDAVARWNETTSDVQPVRVGVAVHAGRAMLGSIGPPDRRDYTIISDAVNVTSRLEELNKHFRSAMIISGSVAELCGQLPVGFLGPETVDIRGHAEPMQVYHLPPA